MKNNLSKEYFDSTKQLFRKMRTTCFLLFAFAFGVFATPGRSQVAKISIILKNSTVAKVIDAIEKQTDYLFVYSKNEIDITREVSIDVEQQSVAEVLSEIFDNTNIIYAMEGSNIMLMPRSSAQQPLRQISGKVIDASGASMPGTSVVIKGTSTGVVTDTSGNFSLALPPDANKLIFSFVGMRTQEINMAGKTTIIVTMENETIGLEDVVVVGYGTVKKADILGSVAVVNAKSIENLPVADPMQALQGKAAGVDITSVSGQPGAGYQIHIRGIQSINASVDPVYVVDGIITESMSFLNANDIESVSILKDAASSAIYGARAANGVVLITTKQGVKNQAPVISFNTYQGISTWSDTKVKMLTSAQYLQLNDEAITNDPIPTGQTLEAMRGYTNADLQAYKDASGNYRNTNWLNQISQTGRTQYYDINVRGGSERNTYYTSLSYQDQTGIIKSQEAQNINLRFNSTNKINKFIEFGNTLDLYVNKNQGLPDFNGLNAQFSPDPYMQAFRKSPLSEAHAADGGYGINQNQNIEGNWMPPNVITDLYKRKVGYTGAVGNFYIKFNLAEGLTFTPRLSMTYAHNTFSNFTPGISLVNTIDGSTKSALDKNSADNFHWQTDYLLNYTHTFNKVHNLSALLDYSQEETTSEYMDAKRSNFPLNNIYYLGAGDPSTQTNDNTYQEYSFVSYIGRVNYDYNGKYYAQATVRRDGCSRFAPASRWGIFPSYSAGWRISKEDFFKLLSDVVSDLKLRASLGTLGNAGIGNYPTYSSLYPSTVIMNESKVGGYTLTNAINTNVKWESTQKSNFGMDATFLNSKIYLTTDYFISTTTNMLWQKPLPLSAGKYGAPFINAGKMQNKGWEFELGYRDKKGDFTYDVSANLSAIRNKAVNLAGQDDVDLGMITGEPIFSYYGLSTNGIIKTQSQLDAYKAKLYTDVADGKFKAQLGDVRYRDLNGRDANGNLTGKPDGQINGDDRTVIGKKYPDFTYGFVANVSYKRFSLQIQASGVQGIDVPIQGQTLTYFTSGNVVNENNIVLQRWNATANPNGNMPRLSRLDANNNHQFSDIWLSDASYLRINNVNIGYDLPDNICQKLSMKNMKVYFSAQNLYTFTKYKGGEPDVTYGDGYHSGNPIDKMTQPTTFVLGVKLSF